MITRRPARPDTSKLWMKVFYNSYGDKNDIYKY